MEDLAACMDVCRTWNLLIEARSNDGNTVLHMAAHGGSVEAFKFLQSLPATDLMCRNAAGKTPLQVMPRWAKELVILGEQYSLPKARTRS